MRDDKVELAKLNRLEKELSGSKALLDIEPVADVFEKDTDNDFNRFMTIQHDQIKKHEPEYSFNPTFDRRKASFDL